MITKSKMFRIGSTYLAAALLALAGCQVGGVVEDADPEPDYIVDVGYPPGCYREENVIVYNGQRYDPVVFRQTIVQENIINNRYTNVSSNAVIVNNIRPTVTHGGSGYQPQSIKPRPTPKPPVPNRPERPEPPRPTPEVRPMPTLPNSPTRRGGNLYGPY